MLDKIQGAGASDVDLQFGKVKWFSRERGFGFIVPHGGGPDIFVHMTVCRKHNLPEGLAEGQQVRFSSEVSRKQQGKLMANFVEVLSQ